MGHDELVYASDQELLTKLNNGNRVAFDVLYNKYWKQVYNTAYKRISNTELAQDIAQEVFIQLWTREAKTPILNLPAYLQASARNGVFKQLEKESKYAMLPEELLELNTSDGSADTAVLFKEFLETFKELVATLPTQQKVIFNLRFHAGLSSQEIADQMDISVKTVRNQMGKALARIRQSLILIQLAAFLSAMGDLPGSTNPSAFPSNTDPSFTIQDYPLLHT
ncbi:RNA polymerase sigma factor [Chitinophaga sp. RAB17]|uniref:RNA polymerase sigma factor n=1 Tax=Chitinophaga sp. RAB17 TaxID=3233049 RepID=UPI003F8E3A47